MTGTRLAAVLAAGQRHLAATGANEASGYHLPHVVVAHLERNATGADEASLRSATKRLAKEALDIENNPIDNVVLVREPWDDAPSDRVPERWSLHVRGQYALLRLSQEHRAVLGTV